METREVGELPPINHPKLFLLLGPSGAGKSEIIKKIHSVDSRIVPTTVVTDRSGRGEDFGKKSVTPEEFQTMKRNGEFLSCEPAHGNWYGILKSSVMDPLNRGEVPIQDYPEDKVGKIREIMGDLATIYIVPPSMGELRKRLQLDDRDLDGSRFNAGREELLKLVRQHFRTANIDDVVINRNIEEAARQTLASIYERVK